MVVLWLRLHILAITLNVGFPIVLYFFPGFIVLLQFIICFGFCNYRAENMARKAAGEEPLPEEDPSNPIFKPLPEPSRLESFLITNQISNYCNQINGCVTQILMR